MTTVFLIRFDYFKFDSPCNKLHQPSLSSTANNNDKAIRTGDNRIKKKIWIKNSHKKHQPEKREKNTHTKHTNQVQMNEGVMALPFFSPFSLLISRDVPLNYTTPNGINGKIFELAKHNLWIRNSINENAMVEGNAKPKRYTILAALCP